MKKQGYMIAQNGTSTAFFTSSSAYDCPVWTSVNEATTYPTAELADKALQKLLKNGAYSAKLVEASSMEFEFPDEGPNKDQAPITQTDEPMDDEDEMVAGQLSDDPEEDLNIEDDDIEMGDDFEGDEDEFGTDEQSLGADDEFAPEDDEQSLSPIEQRMSQGRRPTMPSGNGPMREGLDTTVTKIKFNQDNRNDRDTNFSQDIEPLYKEVKIPANVMSAIKASIDTFNKAAEFNNGKDDAQASMALTIVNALETIKDCLDQGTHEGLKQAQIKITTFMNPITSNFPPEVIDYLYKSGRQPMSLKDTFYDKWDKRSKEV